MARPTTPRTVPVVVVAGFLGAGKTTLVNHLLASAGDSRIAVIVNDFGRTGIDPLLITGGAESIESSTGGCLCCAAEDDELPAMLDRLTGPTAHVDVVVLEASGLADPATLARRVAIHPGAHVAALVQVVDASEALTTFDRHPEVARRLATADVVVLNKADAAAGTIDQVEGRCRALHPDAPLVRTIEGRVDPLLLLDAPPRRRGPWQPTLGVAAAWTDDRGDDEAHGGDEAHGRDDEGVDHGPHVHGQYDSLELVSDVPLHPGRVAALFDDRPAGMFRAKGVLRLATPEGDDLVVAHVVGRQVRFSRTRRAPEGRTSRLVCIGAGMDLPRLRARLDDCAVRPGEPVAAADVAAVHRHLVGDAAHA
ncbi:CobW family GTP-binding protein [Oerskovia flava]|uniref:CobW family GTP-binding protein n=1 Tax=Oerskovia flava TaxID=2986422 RepID=UPI0022407A85|nr:GTP-binding protein [Oerskovia sp. JB1-3-2]